MAGHPIEFKEDVAPRGHRKIPSRRPDQQIAESKDLQRREEGELNGFAVINGAIALP
jgi:hypothetical protein